MWTMAQVEEILEGLKTKLRLGGLKPLPQSQQIVERLDDAEPKVAIPLTLVEEG